MSTVQVQPLRPPEDPCPRILVLDHSVVECADRECTEAAAHLGDPAQAIHRLCQAMQPGSAPMTALEIAARLGYPRAFTITMLSLLAQEGLVQVSETRASVHMDQIREVIHALRT